MKESDILRLLIITQNGQSGNFESNLLKLVSMVLYDADISGLTVDDIRKELILKYDLEFTNDEIIRAIKKKHSEIISTNKTTQIIRQGKKFTETELYYTLNVKVISKFKSNEESNNLRIIIEKYKNYNPQINKNNTEIEDLLMKFLYYTFNTNKDTLMLFLKGKNISIPSDGIYEYSEEDKVFLNDFLNWDNKEKNELIFLTASYCVDYCMLTIKKDFSSYKDIFKGKSFYLDSNVIFRLAGINNEERRIVTSSFINKCIDQGIIIKYTNFTYEEIRETIRKNVMGIKELTGSKRLVSIKNWKSFTSPYANLDFIKLYDNWTRLPGTQYNDFNSFEKYLIKIINDILRSFKKVNFITYETINQDFTAYCNSLHDYKNKKGARCNVVSVKTDVNNYLYLFDLRNKARGGTFVDLADYFISTDSNLCEWGKEILPSSIPIAVLPSVWHSLILKFKGRTGDDYKAFSLFLNLRYRITDDDFDKRKPDILSLVQSLDEPVNLKDMILDNITEKLSDEYKDIEDVNIIVEKAKDSVINKEVEKLYEINGKKLQASAKENGEYETLLKLAEHSANRIIKMYNYILRFLFWCKITSGIVFTFGLLITILRYGVKFIPEILNIVIVEYSINEWINCIAIIFPILIFLVVSPLKAHFEKAMNFDRITGKQLLRLKNKLSKNR